jgi:hypothetical protein
LCICIRREKWFSIVSKTQTYYVYANQAGARLQLLENEPSSITLDQ